MAPKQWLLTKIETVNSFESWCQNLQYVLSLDPNFALFLVSGASWEKKTKSNVIRGFVDDTAPIPTESRKTAAQKVALLELMLGQIANFCPIISHFLDLADFKLEQDERPKDLFQRLTAFFDDNLLSTTGGLSHHREVPTEDEDISPSLENTVVLLWLKLIHKDLPRLVKQRYGTKLRSRTLASTKQEISQALDSWLDELHTSEDVKIMHSASFQKPSQQWRKSGVFSQAVSRPRASRSSPSCPLCKQAGRNQFNHYLSSCPHLPESNHRFLSRAHLIAALDEELSDLSISEDVITESEFSTSLTSPTETLPSSRRVQVKQSPFFNVFYSHHPLKITIDSGAETNMIRESVAKQIGAHITKSSQLALQADGQSLITITGETRLVVMRDNKEFILEALVA